jgi:hypothetical protein
MAKEQRKSSFFEKFKDCVIARPDMYLADQLPLSEEEQYQREMQKELNFLAYWEETRQDSNFRTQK